jgi:hypothetical protein
MTTTFNGFEIDKHNKLFRPITVIRWAHYTVEGIKIAIEHDVLSYYYEEMLKDPRSPQLKLGEEHE